MRWTFDDGGRKAAGYLGKNVGDCVTRAIAIATGKPYQEVYDTINERAQTERKGKRMRGRSHARTGVHKPLTKRYLEELGWTWHATMGIGTGCKVHLRDGEVPAVGRYVVSLSKHLTALVDGVIHDLYDPSRHGTRCVYGYWSPPAKD